MATPDTTQERRQGVDRRATPGRRAADRRERMRDVIATAFAICGGLVVLYVFFVAIGAVDLGDALIATGVAVALAAIWLIGAYQRYKSGAVFITRSDRERRGF